jgi:acetoin utilization protein AcuB
VLVQDIMSQKVVAIDPEMPIADVYALMEQRNIRHFPIVDASSPDNVSRLVGIVSDRDLRDLSPPRDTPDQENTLGWVRIRDMMSLEVVTAHPLDTIEHAARVIHENKFNCLPVVADGEPDETVNPDETEKPDETENPTTGEVNAE